MNKILIIIFILFPLSLSAQFIPESPENTGIYDFLDELASADIISFNQAVKPLSKTEVAGLLMNAEKQKELLTLRQQKELDFYLQGYSIETGLLSDQPAKTQSGVSPFRFLYNPVSITYGDSLFKASIRPLAGGFLYINDKAKVQNRWWGATINGYIGKHFAFYTSLTDHSESEALAKPTYLTQLIGGKYKPAVDRTGGEFSTILGGVTWGWKWGHIGLVYDRPVWGSGYNGTNIISGRVPPFPQLVLRIKPARWFEYNYLHGWLASEIVDSSRSFTSGHGYINVYYKKYIAANIFTFTPWNFLSCSVGNSIIYSNPSPYPGFLIPNLFFRSVDENYTYINNNSQLFFDFNLRPVKHIHLYGSAIFDDFRLSRITNDTVHNLYSVKTGLRSSGWPLDNLIFTAEYTRTTPIMYKHRMDVLTYATNNYSLGHYLRDNSEEIFAQVEWKLLRGATLYLSYLDAKHCNEYQYTNGIAAVQYPVLKDKIWSNRSITGGINYELFAGTFLKGSIMYSNITSVDADGQTAAYYQSLFTPPFLQGKHVTVTGGFSVGF